MNKYQIAQESARFVDLALNWYRETASKAPGSRPIEEISQSPELQELRVRRRIHGPVPSHYLRMDDLDLFIVKGGVGRNRPAPEDGKFEHWGRLNRKIAAKRANNRKRHLVAAATVALFFIVSGSSPLLSGKDLVKESNPVPGVEGNVYIDDSTGYGQSVPQNEADPVELHWAAFGFDREFIRAERWSLGSAFHYVIVFPGPNGRVFVSRLASDPESRTAPDLDKMVATYGENILNGIQFGDATPDGKIIEEIEGRPVEFQKWETRHPDTGQEASVWVGRPIRQRSDEEPLRTATN